MPFARLVAAVRGGDEHAFGVLWQRTNPGLVRYVGVVAPGRVESVTAAVWRDLVRELPRFRGDESQWRTWAFATARHLARQTDGAPVTAAHNVTVLRARRFDDVVTKLALDILTGLVPAEREVLVLRTAGELSAAQIADVTGQDITAVATIARTALVRAGSLASDPALRRRIDRGAPATAAAPPAAPLPGPLPAEAILDDLLAGRPARPGASSRTRLMAALVAALSAPPLAEEEHGPGPAYAAFRRRFAAGPRHARVSLRLGSRVAVAAGVASIAMSGTLVAAYNGVLPGRLQEVAHDWLNAPHAKTAGPGPDNRSGSPRSGDRPAGPASIATTRPGHRRGEQPPAPGPTPTAPGPAGTPPGATVTPPGSTNTPPTDGATPPGTTKTPPSGGKTPPGTTKTPPSGGKTPPGTTKTPPSGSRSPPKPSAARSATASASGTKAPFRPRAGGRGAARLR
jgi:DNA-directed RNA polymerase specialized sigma24 family protein